MMPQEVLAPSDEDETAELDYKALAEAFCFHPRFKSLDAGTGECWDGTEWCSEQWARCATVESDAGAYTKLVLHSTRAATRMVLGLGNVFAKLRHGARAHIALVVTGGKGQWVIVKKTR